MTFTGFTNTDFEVFTIEGLDQRMKAIQERIQPKFKEIGTVLTDELSIVTGNEMFLHIAKHARRTVNPPKDTWLAICHNNRGYKQHPHFQVGVFDDHVFVWLAFIYELPNKKQIATNLLTHVDEIQERIPSNYVVSYDHTKKESHQVSDFTIEDWVKGLERFRDIKKAEFLVGRHFQANSSILADGDQFVKEVIDTFHTLLPLYKRAFEE